MTRATKVLVVFVLFLMAMSQVMGCSGTMDTTYEDGRLYAVNNTRQPTLPGGTDGIKKMWVIYEGIEYYPPNNMTALGAPTNAGCIELTEDPLPGGTIVPIVFKFDHMHGLVSERDIDVTIDGNMTIDIYMADWYVAYTRSTVIARVVPGKWSGTTIVTIE